MNEKLLEYGSTIEDAVKRINELVSEDFEILDKNDDDISKWTTIPKLILLDEVRKKKIMQFIEYMDTASLPLKEKAMILVSLSGIIEYTGLDINEYDDGDLYLLADHYQNVSIEDIKQTINVLKNKDLLHEIRKQTLDLEDRKLIIDRVDDAIYVNKLNTNNTIAVADFIKNQIAEIEDTDFYN